MPLPDFRLERYFAIHEFNTPYHLCASDSETVSIGELLAREKDALSGLLALPLSYTESNGAPSLRKRIASLYEDLSPEHILVHAGAEEAVFTFMHALIEKDDLAVVQWPCYQSLFQIADHLGAKALKWRPQDKNGEEFTWDLDELARLMSRGAKALVINSPHNPTGAHFSRDEFREINRLAEEHGTTVFSDEVYRYLEYREEDRLPGFCDINPKAVSLGVMSKTFGLPGLRIGWAASRDEELLARMASVKDYLTICSSAPSEYLSELALRHYEWLAGRSRDLVLENLALADEFFAGWKDIFTWPSPKAGSIAFPGLKGGSSAREFCDELIQKAGVLLLPGDIYAKDYGCHFRLGLGRKNFTEALGKLDAYLQNR